MSSRHQAALKTADQRLQESENFHMGTGQVHRTMQALANDLQRFGIDYAVAGAMALNAHGYARETVDVDVIIREEGLEAFHEECVGRGYRPAFEGARKTFKNTATGGKVEFIIAGGFPGDGKPKPVTFPDPANVAVDINGIRYISLRSLIELKLASGMTQPARRRDLADVQDLIRILRLDASFADQLDPYVRPIFRTLLDELGNTDPHVEAPMP
jgi:hypothetical protein